MSKFVKDLITNDLKQRLTGVGDLLVVNIVGLDALSNSSLRKELREKQIHLMMVKNSLARRATEGTELAPAFEGSAGSLALMWGSTDIVALAKEVTRLTGDKKYAKFEARGGVMGGAPLSADEIKKVSKWPSREEQLSLLMGQVLSPGATLVGQLASMGGALASQIKQISEKEGAEPAAESPVAAAPVAEAPAAEAPPAS